LTILKRKKHKIWKTLEKRMKQIQNKTEIYSSRIEQTEDRISELKDEMAVKGKTEELLVKQLKTCEKESARTH
jgi:tRNA A58 N-methylase Trm61